MLFRLSDLQIDKFHKYMKTIEISWNVSFIFFRSKGILPYDHNRVELEEYIDADDYVNASWIGGDEKLIATQGPLPTTVKHFLQMIVEREVELIVMLGTHMEKDNKGIST